MAKFSLLDDNEEEIDVPSGDVLEIIPDDQLDSHAPDEGDAEAMVEPSIISEGLEACMQLFNEAAEQGGVTPQLAKALSLSLALAGRNTVQFGNAVSQRDGIQRALAGIGRFGLEDFRDTPSSTSYGLEGVSEIWDKIKDMWRGAMKWMQEMYQKIAAWFDKFISGAAFAKRKAEAIIKRIRDDKVKGTQKTEKIKLSKSEVTALAIDGKVSFDTHTKLQPLIRAVLPSNLNALIGSYIASMKKMIESDPSNIARLETKAKTLSASYGDIFERLSTGDDKHKVTNESIWYKSKHIYGDKRLYLHFIGTPNVTPDGKDSTTINFKEMAISIDKVSDSSLSDEEITALEKGAVEISAKGIITACEELIKAKDIMRKQQVTLKEFNNDVSKLINTLDSNKKFENRGGRLNFLAMLIGGLSSTITAPTRLARETYSLVMTNINGSLNVCVKSLNHYSEKDD